MISKELLSEILSLEVCSVSNFLRDGELEYQFISDRNTEYGENNAFNEIIYPPRRINIYELAHKCKEWAYINRYILKSFITKDIGYCIIETSIGKDMVIDAKLSSSESEAIFKACQWILENKDKK